MEIKSSTEKYEHLRLKENKAEKFTKAGRIGGRQQTLGSLHIEQNKLSGSGT